MQTQELVAGAEVYDEADNLAYTVLDDPQQDGPIRVYFRVRWALDGGEESRSALAEYEIPGNVIMPTLPTLPQE
jgi:hypothetical protein